MMCRLIRILLILQLCVLLAAQKTELDTPENLQLFGQFRHHLFQIYGNKNLKRSGKDAPKYIQNVIPPNVPFPCNVTGGRSPQVPTSVHRLRPGDIDVIGGMGDSLTAGNGIFATNYFEMYIESRGASGSSGGQGNWRTSSTLPNILKEFNPKLFGYALGDSFTAHPASQFNVAEAGAMSRDMPFMAQYLVNKIKKDPRVDMKHHWKFISIMVGSNDICLTACTEPSPWSIVDKHKKDLLQVLRILRDNLPRTYVGLILPPDIVKVLRGKKSVKCYLFLTMECPCLIGLKNQYNVPLYYEVLKRWQEVEEEVAEYAEFHKEDFTVEVLPVLKRVNIPLTEDGYPDFSYMAYDCFHVSQKSNSLYGNTLWNNLLELYGNKSTSWFPMSEKFLCPTPRRPYLTTRENSWRSNNSY